MKRIGHLLPVNTDKWWMLKVILINFYQMNTSVLIGKWITDPEDKQSLETFGLATIEFKKNGEMIYMIESENGKQIILLTYIVENGFIITDQPSSPHKEKTKFSINNDKLELIYETHKVAYIKV